MDSDSLFLSEVSDIWDHFEKFNSSQLAGMIPEHQDKHDGWYKKFARHPYYGELGLNSGVILMKD